MLTWIAKKLFGTSNERALRRLQPLVVRMNALEPELQALSDAELQAKTAEFKQRIDNGAPLDSLLAETFAVCREASWRVLKMRHFDVQMLGGMVLHRGRIAEMRTGEGKTLVATLPIYLNALQGKGVHLITVNDYLATRDAEWMGRLYNWLGLSIGTIVNGQSDADKRIAYRRDICYGQNNEFGFDYLRDNMKFSALDYVQRDLNFAIVDEVDSILIDEARTPLIISGTADAASEMYRTLNEVVHKLRKDEHYVVDEKGHSANLTDDGVEAVQRLAGVDNLYDPAHIHTLHILNQLLRANALYKRDQHYMVSPDGKIMIIDEFTGRVLQGRRWSDGLHQAVEAKENVRIQEESRTMATITFQNLFRLYKKLGGMTGTATTEAQEFSSTYKLDVNEMPTHRNMIRVDDHDVVFKTEREKFTAVIREIMEQHEQGRPVLVGTTSVEKSAAISRILQKKDVSHHVLNAKHHANEAFVVAQAGRKGAITVSTNMAGRGTDIMLGGNPEMLARLELQDAGKSYTTDVEEFASAKERIEAACKQEHDEVLELGGLHIIGTERHESRRIDNQLRGRAGRQGDRGSSRFYLSLEDDLMRIFGGDRVKNLMDRMGMPDDEPIEHPWVTKSIENAQRKVEERNFDIRKHLLEYDDVMNAQRKMIYVLRQQLLLGRYTPEETDEMGVATGKTRAIPANPEITERISPLVAQLVGMFAEPPVTPRNDDGQPRAPTVEELAAAPSIAEPIQLQHEVYQYWGIKLDLEERRQLNPTALLEELIGSVSHGLTEQHERLLDLVDQVCAAIVKECCPAERPAEDWDWAGLYQGFRESFATELGEEVENFGEPQRVVKFAYQAAEASVLAKEQELGLDLAMRVFRHLYLETIDESWVEHLTNMEHLRDGIGLRGYGQRDPKNEYKKEGYNLFVDMMARVSGSVLTKFFAMQVQRQDDVAAMEHAAEQRHQAELESVIARHLGEEGDMSSDQVLAELQRLAADAPPARQAPEPLRIEGGTPCPCGSGKPFLECHGADSED